MRADLADVRLASQVFAPHYAAPMAMRVTTATSILAKPSPEAETLAVLEVGDIFDVLEVASSYCWGQGRISGLVGYAACDSLSRVSAAEENAA